MALHFNLKSLYEKYPDEPESVQLYLELFCKEAAKILKKIKLGIEDKKHLEIKSLMLRLKPYLEFLDMDEALDEAESILYWTDRLGKKKEVKEIYKVFKIHVKNAIKEIHKNFDIPHLDEK